MLLHDEYRAAWPDTVPWDASRFQRSNCALFTLLFCAEMWGHLSGGNQPESGYAGEIALLAEAALKELEH